MKTIEEIIKSCIVATVQPENGSIISGVALMDHRKLTAQLNEFAKTPAPTPAKTKGEEIAENFIHADTDRHFQIGLSPWLPGSCRAKIPDSVHKSGEYLGVVKWVVAEQLDARAAEAVKVAMEALVKYFDAEHSHNYVNQSIRDFAAKWDAHRDCPKDEAK